MNIMRKNNEHAIIKKKNIFSLYVFFSCLLV